jgi:hypothetical protein
VSVNLLEFRGGGTPGCIERGGEGESHQTLSASVWGLGTLWLGNALVEQGFEPVKGIATGNQLSQELFGFSRRSEALVQSVKSEEVAKPCLEKAKWMA